MNWNDTYDNIVEDERFVTKIYLDTAAKTKDFPNGIPTVGPGISLLPGVEFPPQAITEISCRKFRRCIEDFYRFERTHHLELDSVRRSVITEMIWNMGYKGVLRFAKMITAMQFDDWGQAAAEIIDSKTHRRLDAERIKKMREKKLKWWQIRTEKWADMMRDGEV